MNEFNLIKRYFTHNPRSAAVRVGVGDDAAIVAPEFGVDLAVAADMLVAGRHFFQDADPFDIGFKSLAVNLSDMAAMGAQPTAVTLCLALPAADEKWLSEFARGFWTLADRYRVDLIGGDTTAGPLTIAIQVWGSLPRGRALLRSGARIGDEIWVSGSIGSAAFALRHCQGEFAGYEHVMEACLERLNRPEPRVLLGQSLLSHAHSAVDISDGLLSDLGHIIEASQVGAEVDWHRVPLASSLEPLRSDAHFRDVVLAGGDDYELCFTAPVEAADQIQAAGKRHNVSVTKIGRITDTKVLKLKGSDGEFLPIGRRGFDHFDLG